MGPVEDVVLGRAVQALESILRGPCQVKRLQAKVLQARVKVLQARDHGIAAHVVVGVPENLDVGMEGFQGVLGVLQGCVSAARDRACGNLTIEFTAPVSPVLLGTPRGLTHESKPGAPPCTR